MEFCVDVYLPRSRTPSDSPLLLQRIMGVKYSFPPNLHLSGECTDIISKIFMGNPAHRITIAGIRSHPWFLKNLPEELKVWPLHKHGPLPYPKGAEGCGRLLGPQRYVRHDTEAVQDGGKAAQKLMQPSSQTVEEVKRVVADARKKAGTPTPSNQTDFDEDYMDGTHSQGGSPQTPTGPRGSSHRA